MNWDQLKTVLWLRARLTRNQWARGGNLGAIITVLMVTAATILSISLFAGAIAGGVFALRTASPYILLVTWDVVTLLFLFSWMVGLLTELQRSETIDLQRLMHLPVALGQIFTINYIASHFVLSIVLFVPVMIGLGLGLSISRGPAMLLLLPLAIATVFMISAWTYCLRGWLAALMTNPRRRRNAVVLISVVFILISQGPNIFFNVLNTRNAPTNSQESREKMKARQMKERQVFEIFVTAQKYLPPLWLPVAAKGIAEGKIWPALAAAAGCLAIGAAGLRRAYVTTVRFYRGGESAGTARTSKAKERPAATTTAKPRTCFTERSLPGFPDDAAAVALATFRSMLRAPEAKMQWLMALLMTAIFGAMFIMRAVHGLPPMVKPLAISGMLAMSMLMLVQAMANQFGFDRAGFRTFVLAPVDRKHVLLGKNAANFPIAGSIAVLVTVISGVMLKVGVTAMITVLLQFVVMFFVVATLGNALSIMVPYRIRQASLKPTKLPAKVQVIMFLTHMCFPLVMTPTFLPSLAQLGWDYAKLPAFPISIVLASAFAVAAVAGYWFSLAPLGRLFQRREMKMLDLLATEVE